MTPVSLRDALANFLQTQRARYTRHATNLKRSDQRYEDRDLRIHMTFIRRKQRHTWGFPLLCALFVSTALIWQLGPTSGTSRRGGTATELTFSKTADYGSGRHMAVDPTGGYWTVNPAGVVRPHGGAPSLGSIGPLDLNGTVVAMAATPNGQGYWLVAVDGGVFSFGDAGFYGSAASLTLNQPIVGMSATADGRGYWLVAQDGGVFGFGDAGFFGSTGPTTLSQPIVGMTPTMDGRGYWLVAVDGGVFSFGDAGFYGSLGSVAHAEPIIALARTPDGGGYWLLSSDGGVFPLGDAPFFGSANGTEQPMDGIVIHPDGPQYALVTQRGTTTGDFSALGTAPALAGGQTLPTPPPLAPPPAESSWSLVETAPVTSPGAVQWGIYGTQSSNPENNWLSSYVNPVDGTLDLHSQGQEGGGLCLCWNQSVSLYGRWQIQARFVGPSDHGFAILLWPDNDVWPQDGEIDIAEKSAPAKAETSSVVYGEPDAVQSIWIAHPELTVAQWHTYTVDWEPGEISIYVDGTLSQTVTEHVPVVPMHLALQAEPLVPKASDGSGDLYVSSVQVFAPR